MVGSCAFASDGENKRAGRWVRMTARAGRGAARIGGLSVRMAVGVRVTMSVGDGASKPGDDIKVTNLGEDK